MFNLIESREASGLVKRPPASELIVKRSSHATAHRGGNWRCFFQVSGKNTAGRISAKIQEELNNSCSIGYSPDLPPTGGGYRGITLDTKQKGLIVRTRDGYYPAS